MDTLEMDDAICINKNLSMTGLITPADVQRRKSSTCTTVTLALLCALLLAGNIGQIIYYEFLSHYVFTNPSQSDYNIQTQEKDHPLNGSTTAKPDHLQSAGSWSAERKQLEASLSNVAEEKHKLQQRCDALAAERDEFKAGFKNMTSERDLAQASFSALKQESGRMQTSYDDLQRSLQELQTQHSSLQRDSAELQTRFRTLTANRDQIQNNYFSLKTEKDELQRNYDVFRVSKDQLQRSYNSLWNDKDQLQARYNALWREKAWLQSNHSSLVTGQDHLQRRLSKVTAKLKGIRCQTGWTKFDISCYLVSTTSKNWTDSRKACEAAGADLVIIDDKDEQEYVNGLLKLGQSAWIGLTVSLEGAWRWVDGSPVTTAFWQPGQPNNYYGEQHCAELLHKSGSGAGFHGEWNDDGCFAEQTWICEQ